MFWLFMSPEAMLTTERREVQNDHRLPLSQYLRGSQEVVQIITDYRSELTAQNCARRKLDTNSSLSWLDIAVKYTSAGHISRPPLLGEWVGDRVVNFNNVPAQVSREENTLARQSFKYSLKGTGRLNHVLFCGQQRSKWKTLIQTFCFTQSLLILYWI